MATTLVTPGRAQPQPLTLAPDAAWCWFGNPRALFKDGQLYFSYVRFSDGRACLNVLDLGTRISTLLWASVMTERDDHDNPALLELTDHRLLAIYQKHGSEQKYYYRLTTNAETAVPSHWTAETVSASTGAGVTYANPYQLSAESGRIYSFLRNLNFNPTFVTSDASATNWSAPTHFIKTGTGSTRPYVQYASDGTSRIDVIYTDGHPDSIPCSLYHLFYEQGALRQTDGTFLKYLTNAPLLHDSGERGAVIYPYNTAPQSDPNEWIPSARAWCWDLAYQTNGAPVAVFCTHLPTVTGTNWFDDRLYYYYARWTGTNWQRRFIAHAGRPLYQGQQNYAGGITIDPNHPDVVYLSSNAANPFDLTTVTNVPLRASSRYEIWRGTTTDGGLSFAWQAVTTNSAVDNLRPYVPRRNPYPVGVIWYAGTYTSYTSWNTTAFGYFGTNLVPFVMAANGAPQINLLQPTASPLLFSSLTQQLRVRASVSDDGSPGPLTQFWDTVSGPTNAVFADATQADTSVRFPQAGDYVLRLTASDTSRTSYTDLAVFAGGTNAQHSDAGLALWLKLDETAGTVAADSSTNGNSGAVSGGAMWQPAGGLRGGNLVLNGTNSFVNVPDAPTLDSTSAFTLAWWFRANSYTTGGAGLVSKRNAISDNNAYTTFLQVDHLIYVDIDGSNDRFASVTAFDTNRWYHVAVTFDGSQIASQRARLYVNGTLDKVAAETSTAIPNYNSSLKVGLTHSNVTTFLNGAMDDVRLYRRALSDSEVATLAAVAQSPTVATGPAPAATNALSANLSGSASSDGSGGPLRTWWSQSSGPGAAVFADSSLPGSTVTFNQAGSYGLRLSASNSIAEVFGNLLVNVAPNPNIFADWTALAFPGETNTAILGPAADPDGDGRNNFTEFGLSGDPRVAEAKPSWIAAIEDDHLTLSYPRRLPPTDVSYWLESAGSITGPWTNLFQETILSNNATFQFVKATDSVATTNAPWRFLRLKITQP